MSKQFITLVIGAFLCASSLQAQTTSQQADTTLQFEEIVIQASKLPISPRETSRPVTIIDRKEIEESSGSNLAQLLHEQSGIRINNSQGSPANNQDLFLQGASTEYTLILLDGVAVSDASGIGGAIDLRLLPLQNVERIEILKGNQSTLYGSSALAGVINIITKSTSESTFQPSGTVEYGAYNSFKGAGDISGSVNDVLSYSLGYNHKSSDGISAAATPKGSDTFQNDGYSQNSFYVNVAIEPVEGLKIKPFVKYSDFEGDYDADAFVDASNTFTNNMWNPGLQAIFESGDFNINSTYLITETERIFSSEFGETALDGRFQNFDTFLNYRFNPTLNIMAGINWQEGLRPEDEENQISEISTSFTSPYGTLLLDAGNGLRAEAGYRANIHSEYGTNSTYSFSPSYQINNSFKLFASIGTGFKAPTIDQLFGQFGANPDLEPEESRSIQVGFETYLLDQSLKIETHYFDREIDNLIAFTSNGYINRDRVETQGVEIRTNWLATNDLTLGAFYNYLDGETITLNDAGAEQSSIGLIRLPNHNFGLNASYRFENGLLVKIDGEFAGDRTDLFFNPANNYTSEEVSLDSYVIANLYAEYAVFDRSFTIFGTVRNLIDSDFTEVYGYNTMGLHARAGVRFTL
ncbi:TonB-dependent receptor plug domain-containing protein [Rhodohalobacter sulfatireducens]|uniref:TonB-dependent receptor n=1 Tax=Rhodohalobacter sulfatireducens TaxID=2911366 RepID=A0ABS9KB91_9BACT|nr:TonB-dependent receptor [Rhodohalobacter sulfatireducens]MCG2588104.1 TonB-dependent receptor [Rhodohalobacter sulfatireducens]